LTDVPDAAASPPMIDDTPAQRMRSRIFAAYLYTFPFLIFIFLFPTLLHPPAARRVVRFWAVTVLWGLKAICGLSYRVEGRENVPAGPCLIACKHQSMWETVALLPIIEEPVFVMKQELMKLPLYGWFAQASRHIGVDREGGAIAMRAMIRAAQARVAEGRQVVIFPEGTRVAPGESRDYQPGAAGLYAGLGLPCVPAALNSGLYWVHPGLLRRQGEIVLRFAEPIPPGLPRKEFMALMRERIEGETEALLREGRARLTDRTPR